MNRAQNALLSDVPPVGRYVFFDLTDAAAPVVRQSLVRLADVLAQHPDPKVVVGLGLGLVQRVGAQVPGLLALETLIGVVVAGPAMDGSSFVAVQQWQHDLDAFEAMSPLAQDHMIGRRRADNEELDDAPASAHVKRTAQESFQPEAFVLRRSMPWAAGDQAGLMFVTFGKSLDAFEAQLGRMVGLEDGVVDALFGMSTPVSSAYFWCPPMHAGKLDLRQLGL